MAQHYAPGDLFAVPIAEGRYGVGQILSVEHDALDSVGCIFFAATVSDKSGTQGVASPIAVELVTPDLLRSGRWKTKGNFPVGLPPEAWPYNRYRSSGWVGAKIRGSAVIESFLAAFHGLAPWDDFHDPKYLDSFLLPGVERPANVRFR